MCGNSVSAAALRTWLEEWRVRISAEGDPTMQHHVALDNSKGSGKAGRATERARRALDSDSEGDDTVY